MNMLNKVKIEGIIKDEPKSKLYANNTMCYSFDIETRRFEGKQEGIEKEESVLSVIFSQRAEFPQDNLKEHLRPGQQIRVIGHLKSDGTGRFIIVAKRIKMILERGS